ncbi:MAG: DUF2950 domain-containing protein [Hyphomicrobiales bacterium]
MTNGSNRGSAMVRRLVSAAALALVLAAPLPALAVTQATMNRFVGAPSETFADADQAVAALKLRLAAQDVPGLAKLLGLNADELAKTEDFDARLGKLKNAAQQRVYVEDEGEDRKVVNLGDLVYPFPFPLVKKDGQWSFDTKAGIQEVVDRRIGENELNAIKVCRDYIAAQKVYASKDRDGDNVLEYAQKLISTPGKQDGLYWHAEPGEDESPAGPFVNAEKIDKGKVGDGYYGYHFRILTKQGDNVAGGAYDYVINGNMIAGFALIAWPVRWGETGIMTFACSHAGVVYERNLGPNTAEIVKRIKRFNPLPSWAVTRD